MENQEGQTLVNPNFEFDFAGKKYYVKKVNLRQVMEFQQKVSEIGKNKEDPTAESKMLASALYIVLHSVDANITEDFILDNCPGDMEMMSVISLFGFMSQRKTGIATSLSNVLVKKPNGENSSAS